MVANNESTFVLSVCGFPCSIIFPSCSNQILSHIIKSLIRCEINNTAFPSPNNSRFKIFIACTDTVSSISEVISSSITIEAVDKAAFASANVCFSPALKLSQPE